MPGLRFTMIPGLVSWGPPTGSSAEPAKEGAPTQHAPPAVSVRLTARTRAQDERETIAEVTLMDLGGPKVTPLRRFAGIACTVCGMAEGAGTITRTTGT